MVGHPLFILTDKFSLMNCLPGIDKKYDLHFFTGRVTGLGRDHVLYTFGRQIQKNDITGNKWLPAVQVKAAGTAFNHIFLTNTKGKEHSIRLADFDVPCRDGHEITAIWAIRQYQNSGPHIAVINESTSQAFFAMATIRKMFRPALSFYAVAATLVAITGYLLTGKAIGILLILIPGMTLVLITIRWRSHLAALKLVTRLRILIKK